MSTSADEPQPTALAEQENQSIALRSMSLSPEAHAFMMAILRDPRITAYVGEGLPAISADELRRRLGIRG